MQLELQYSLEELKQIVNNFTLELENSRSGKQSSLSWLISPLPDRNYLNVGSEFQVMAIGGSNYHGGVFRKQADTSELVGSISKLALPKFTSAQVFLDFIVSQLAPGIDYLTLNLAYPIEPLLKDNLIDAKLLKATKEHEFVGLIGQYVGTAITDYIHTKLERVVKVSVANDTVCLVLAGLNLPQSSKAKIVGGIVGTGVNFGMFLGTDSIVNLETGNFASFRASESGQWIDARSNQPGAYLFEKEVAGAYMWQHYNYYNEKYGLNYPQIDSTDDLSTLIRNHASGFDLAQALLDRAASLVAAQVAGIANYKRLAELQFIMEGSVFWKAPGFKKNIVKLLPQLTETTIDFAQLELSYLLGPANLF